MPVSASSVASIGAARSARSRWRRAFCLRIAGGAAGPVTTAELEDELPRIKPVHLRSRQLQRLLGASVAAGDVEQRLRSLGMGVRPERAGWSVQPPSWRFDIEIEPDLIEEVVRIGGLDSIEERASAMAIVPRALSSGEVDERVVMRTLAARGYQEVITFGFVDPALQQQLFGEHAAIELANPIAADLAIMRTSLLPGLIAVARENLRRQQQRVRVFEIANRFVVEDGERGAVREQKMLAGLALGARLPEQWGSAATPVDFYDVKGDLQALLALGGGPEEFLFEPAAPGHLHPGRGARIVSGGAEFRIYGRAASEPGTGAGLNICPNLVRTRLFDDISRQSGAVPRSFALPADSAGYLLYGAGRCCLRHARRTC